ncbi:hypothetical protein TNCV_2535651 [Trichonephila clavipes]|nr:hypothetical protein TNCV_2535651 [Trichonephila clavipes]
MVRDGASSFAAPGKENRGERLKKKDRYLNSLPPRGGCRKRAANEDETGVTSRGREGKSAEREGLTAPKRVRGAPKRSGKENAAFFLQPE